MSDQCPLCGAAVEADQGPILMGDDGLPLAMSIVPGLGLPLADVGSTLKLDIIIDGDIAGRCVAFDRTKGLIWRYQADVAGNYMRRDGNLVIEKVAGKVSLKLRKERA